MLMHRNSLGTTVNVIFLAFCGHDSTLLLHNWHTSTLTPSPHHPHGKPSELYVGRYNYFLVNDLECCQGTVGKVTANKASDLPVQTQSLIINSNAATRATSTWNLPTCLTQTCNDCKQSVESCRCQSKERNNQRHGQGSHGGAAQSRAKQQGQQQGRRPSSNAPNRSGQQRSAQSAQSAQAAQQQRSAQSAQRPPMSPPAEKIAMLTEMGFSESQARDALLKCDNKVEQAVNYLVGGGAAEGGGGRPASDASRGQGPSRDSSRGKGGGGAGEGGGGGRAQAIWITQRTSAPQPMAPAAASPRMAPRDYARAAGSGRQQGSMSTTHPGQLPQDVPPIFPNPNSKQASPRLDAALPPTSSLAALTPPQSHPAQAPPARPASYADSARPAHERRNSSNGSGHNRRVQSPGSPSSAGPPLASSPADLMYCPECHVPASNPGPASPGAPQKRARVCARCNQEIPWPPSPKGKAERPEQTGPPPGFSNRSPSHRAGAPPLPIATQSPPQLQPHSAVQLDFHQPAQQPPAQLAQLAQHPEQQQQPGQTQLRVPAGQVGYAHPAGSTAPPGSENPRPPPPPQHAPPAQPEVPPQPQEGSAGPEASAEPKSPVWPAAAAMTGEVQTPGARRQQQESDPKDWLPPTPYKFSQLNFQEGSFLDVRDEVDKWVAGEVLRKNGDEVRIRFVGWDSKWDENINIVTEKSRFAPFGYFTQMQPGKERIRRVGDTVWCWVATQKGWYQGKIKIVDDQQVQVEYLVRRRFFQRWFHEKTGELRSEHPTEELLKVGQWFKGQAVEVRNAKTGEWEVSEIVQFNDKGTEALYCNVNNPEGFRDWVDLDESKGNVRVLGANIKETEAERKRKADDEKFRDEIKQAHALEIYDCARDGNCLFRAVGHQIYGDVNRHMEIRQKCFNYMEENRDYFEHYVAGESFDAYVKTMREQNVWGDHLELTALREMYNVNLKIYESGHGKSLSERSIGIDQGSLPLMLLSYHGGNHYNSVIDPHHPPPLGDGNDCSVNLRQLRKEAEAQEKHKAEEAKAKAIKEEQEKQRAKQSEKSVKRDERSPLANEEQEKQRAKQSEKSVTRDERSPLANARRNNNGSHQSPPAALASKKVRRKSSGKSSRQDIHSPNSPNSPNSPTSPGSSPKKHAPSPKRGLTEGDFSAVWDEAVRKNMEENGGYPSETLSSTQVLSFFEAVLERLCSRAEKRQQHNRARRPLQLKQDSREHLLQLALRCCQDLAPKRQQHSQQPSLTPVSPDLLGSQLNDAAVERARRDSLQSLDENEENSQLEPTKQGGAGDAGAGGPDHEWEVVHGEYYVSKEEFMAYFQQKVAQELNSLVHRAALLSIKVRTSEEDLSQETSQSEILRHKDSVY
eukprot:g2110.t1